MESPFTVVDNSIDIVGAIVFTMVVYWAIKYIWENHLTIQAKILYFAIITLSLLHVYQVITQVLLNNFASFRIWDIINYLTAMMFLAIVHRLAKKEKTLS